MDYVASRDKFHNCVKCTHWWKWVNIAFNNKEIKPVYEVFCVVVLLCGMHCKKMLDFLESRFPI